MSRVPSWLVYAGSIVLIAVLMEARHQASSVTLRAAFAGAAAAALLPVMRVRTKSAA